MIPDRVREYKSVTGVGLMFEHSDGESSGGLCEDVDAVDMGNGAFSG